jgi:hypothetical protein
MFWFAQTETNWNEVCQLTSWCISGYYVLYISQLMLLYLSIISRMPSISMFRMLYSYEYICNSTNSV